MNKGFHGFFPKGITIEQILFYGTSLFERQQQLGSLKICYGRATVGANTYVTILNLPFESINSYIVHAQESGIAYGYAVAAIGQAENVDGQSCKIHNQGDAPLVLNWFAIGV
jgi:hypothetical protein